MRLATRYVAVLAAAFIAAAAFATTVRELAAGNLFALIGLVMSWLLAGWVVVIARRSIQQLRSRSTRPGANPLS